MRKFVLFMLLYPGFLIAQEKQQLDIYSCYKLARENHPYFKDKQLIQDNAFLNSRNASSMWLPQVTAGAQATYQSEVLKLSTLIPDFASNPPFKVKTIESDHDQYKATLDINQLIYDGGAIKAQKQITNATLQADLLQNESELHKINEQVNQVFFSLLILKENISLYSNLRNTLQERLKQVESALKNGILQQSDADNLTIELLKNAQQIDELKVTYKAGVSNLSELLGVQLADSVVVTIPDVLISDSVIFQRPDIQYIEAQQNVLLSSDKLTLSQLYPKVYAFSQLGYGKPGLNMISNDFSSFYILGVSMKWTLWDWNKTQRSRQAIAIQRNLLDSRKMAYEKNLRMALTNSHAHIVQLENALQTDTTIVILRAEVTKRSSIKLEQGVITASDYINDLNAEIQSKIMLQTHRVQLQQEKVNYKTIKGEL